MIGLTRTACDEGVICASARATSACARDAKRWVLAATILGSSMAFIDGSVVSVALPALQADINTSVRGSQWIVNAYMLTLGALTLVGGAAGDRYGRRRAFALGVIVFTAASIACGLAPNALTLISARALQGIGGALMVPESLAIISATFPEEERGRAIGTWAGFSALTTALGPVLGGWLVDVLSPGVRSSSSMCRWARLRSRSHSATCPRAAMTRPRRRWTGGEEFSRHQGSAHWRTASPRRRT